MVIRVALVVISLLVLGWVTVLLHDRHGGQAAIHDLRHRQLSDARFERDVQRLEDAKFLNPDSKWDIDRAGALLLRNRRRRAAAVLEDLVRREPDNYEAWGVLYSTVRPIDPQRAREALIQLKRLTPLGQ
jgi:hypothetical protein